MAIRVARGKSDKVIEGFIEALRAYEAVHPEARIELYRQNPVSVRVRIVDPAFAPLNRAQRSNLVWRYLDAVSDEVQGDLSALILLTPDEMATSIASLEFDHPVGSRR